MSRYSKLPFTTAPGIRDRSRRVRCQSSHCRATEDSGTVHGPWARQERKNHACRCACHCPQGSSGQDHRRRTWEGKWRKRSSVFVRHW